MSSSNTYQQPVMGGLDPFGAKEPFLSHHIARNQREEEPLGMIGFMAQS